MLILGAIHASDLERLFQIKVWMDSKAFEGKTKKAMYEAISSRFIESIPTSKVASEVTKAMTPNNIEKYVYVIESFRNCPNAWEELYRHYDQFGEESKLKMNAMYDSSFRQLNDEGKIAVITAVSAGEIKTGRKYI
jgi:hypothetical protein